jgi:hypothetical protein
VCLQNGRQSVFESALEGALITRPPQSERQGNGDDARDRGGTRAVSGGGGSVPGQGEQLYRQLVGSLARQHTNLLDAIRNRHAHGVGPPADPLGTPIPAEINGPFRGTNEHIMRLMTRLPSRDTRNRAGVGSIPSGRGPGTGAGPSSASTRRGGDVSQGAGLDVIRAAQEAIDTSQEAVEEAISGGAEREVAGEFAAQGARTEEQATAVTLGDGGATPPQDLEPSAATNADCSGTQTEGANISQPAGTSGTGSPEEGGIPAANAGVAEARDAVTAPLAGSDVGTAVELMDVDPPVTELPTVTAPQVAQEQEAAPRNTDTPAASAGVRATEEGSVLNEGMRERAAAAGLDVDMLQTLPREIALEALRAHNIYPFAPAAGSSGAGPSGNASRHTQPAVEFMASLPAEVLSEAFAAERAIGRGAAAGAAADAGGSGRQLTSAARDFIEALSSFPTDAREDALLGADRALLEQLPPGLRNEAERLHATRGTTAGSASLTWRGRGAAAGRSAAASTRRTASDPLWQLFVESTGVSEMGLPVQPRPLDPGARHLLTEGGVRMLLLHACTYVPSSRLTPAIADACAAHPPAVLEQLLVSPDSVGGLTRLSVQLLTDLNSGNNSTGDAAACTTDGISRAELATAAAASPRSALRLVGLLFHLSNRNSHFAEYVLPDCMTPRSLFHADISPVV